VFMGLAMAVYATHKNWKEVIDGPNGLRAQLDQANQENTQLTQLHNLREEELTAEKLAAERRLAQLEQERVNLVERNVQIQTELDELKQERRDATAAVAATQANNDQLAAAANELRQQIRNEQQARDRAFAVTLAATEELHQLRNEYEAARERAEQLTRQVAGMTTVMRENGLDPDTDPSGVVPSVDGVVTQVRRTGGSQLVELTIGADDGLKEGNTVEVFRGSRYLGRLEILQTSPDKSVGRVDRRFQQGHIQEGDRVATRLKL